MDWSVTANTVPERSTSRCGLWPEVPGAVTRSRASLKPQVSTMGGFGIPIRDVI